MSEIVTAGILVIGDEILSGRTKDKNIGFIAEYLTNIGIDLKEVRVVADEEADIIAALDALRNRYNYVFTTGGIGPTHDDITADSVAKAFGVGIDHHPEVVARFRERWTEQDLNEARLRMARVPDGAELIQSATILAPGFKLGNVIVMAGIPSIMQAMMDIVAPKLKSGVRMLSESVQANAREGDIGGPLRSIASADTVPAVTPLTIARLSVRSVVPFALPTCTSWRIDSPLYCAANARSWAWPFSLWKIGSRCESSRTSRKLPCTSIATSRLIGLPP